MPWEQEALNDEQQAETDGGGRPGQCIGSTFSDGRNPTRQHYAKSLRKTCWTSPYIWFTFSMVSTALSPSSQVGTVHFHRHHVLLWFSIPEAERKDDADVTAGIRSAAWLPHDPACCGYLMLELVLLSRDILITSRAFNSHFHHY